MWGWWAGVGCPGMERCMMGILHTPGVPASDLGKWAPTRRHERRARASRNTLTNYSQTDLFWSAKSGWNSTQSAVQMWFHSFPAVLTQSKGAAVIRIKKKHISFWSSYISRTVHFVVKRGDWSEAWIGFHRLTRLLRNSVQSKGEGQFQGTENWTVVSLMATWGWPQKEGNPHILPF